jgi:hypothetical protein
MGGNVIDLDNIKARAQALQQHAGTTDYAAQVIADNVELVAEVERLRGAAHRDHSEIVRWLRDGSVVWTPIHPLTGLVLLDASNFVERSDYRGEVDGE